MNNETARRRICRARSAANIRLFMEAVRWIAQVGAPWRDLPEKFGNWSSVFPRFRRWACKGMFARIFEIAPDGPDSDYAMIDGTIVRAHRHGAAAIGGLNIGRSAALASSDRKLLPLPQGFPAPRPRYEKTEASFAADQPRRNRAGLEVNANGP